MRHVIVCAFETAGGIRRRTPKGARSKIYYKSQCRLWEFGRFAEREKALNASEHHRDLNRSEMQVRLDAHRIQSAHRIFSRLPIIAMPWQTLSCWSLGHLLTV